MAQALLPPERGAVLAAAERKGSGGLREERRGARLPDIEVRVMLYLFICSMTGHSRGHLA